MLYKLANERFCICINKCGSKKKKLTENYHPGAFNKANLLMIRGRLPRECTGLASSTRVTLVKQKQGWPCLRVRRHPEARSNNL